MKMRDYFGEKFTEDTGFITCCFNNADNNKGKYREFGC